MNWNKKRPHWKMNALLTSKIQSIVFISQSFQYLIKESTYDMWYKFFYMKFKKQFNFESFTTLCTRHILNMAAIRGIQYFIKHCSSSCWNLITFILNFRNLRENNSMNADNYINCFNPWAFRTAICCIRAPQSFILRNTQRKDLFCSILGSIS